MPRNRKRGGPRGLRPQWRGEERRIMGKQETARFYAQLDAMTPDDFLSALEEPPTRPLGFVEGGPHA